MLPRRGCDQLEKFMCKGPAVSFERNLDAINARLRARVSSSVFMPFSMVINVRMNKRADALPTQWIMRNLHGLKVPWGYNVDLNIMISFPIERAQ